MAYDESRFYDENGEFDCLLVEEILAEEEFLAWKELRYTDPELYAKVMADRNKVRKPENRLKTETNIKATNESNNSEYQTYKRFEELKKQGFPKTPIYSKKV